MTDGHGATDTRRATKLMQRLRALHAPARPVPGGDLLPLTSTYLPEQHDVYAAHLDAALADKTLLNIALTGRYGAGKSSVLDETARRHGRRVLRVSLSNLAAAEADESLTNRIEKEFVKQLLHRESPRRVPQSRFRRISTRSLPVSFLVTLFQVGVVAGVLWLLGRRVTVEQVPGDHSWWVEAMPWAGLVVGVVLLLTLVRLATRDHVVSQFSAAGASVTLSKSDSYFDEFLDEIVYFFARVKVDIVILEDLDRFNDPHIFQALRELNTVLNASKQIRRRIRFVYAIRDSVFEKLGRDTQDAGDDDADAEVVLANRTKFFDLVIPLVPFITHNNARDLLQRLLKDELQPVSGELVDLVARRLPDMRLLTNIRNEYSVFAHRLITNKEGVNDLSPDKLFAMVVYKNVHLRDFEQVLLGKGELDRLDQARRDLVRTSIASCEARIRDINNGLAAKAALRRRLETLQTRLDRLVDAVNRGGQGQLRLVNYRIAGENRSPDSASTLAFWEALFATTGPWHLEFHQQYSSQQVVQMGRDDLEQLVGGELDLDAWTARTADQLARERARLEDKIARLRHADFRDLIALSEFKVDDQGADRTFAALVGEVLGSSLAADLVTHGYVDPFYGVYISQYYGGRVSANAMKFLMFNVRNNAPEVHYELGGADIDAVLRETNGSFIDDLSGYNIDVLDHLLAHDTTLDSGPLASQPLAPVLLGHIIGRLGEPEYEFLNSYLAGGTQQDGAIGWLTGDWAEAFTFLIRDATLDNEQRVAFVNAALMKVDAGVEYTFDEDVRAFFARHYTDLDAVTGDHPDGVTDAVARLLVEAGFVCENLAAVSAGMREHLVVADRYTLTAGNLRAATGAPTIGLDALRAANTYVYADCMADPTAYLAAFDADAGTRPGTDAGTDAGTEFTVSDPDAFTDILNDLAGTTSADGADEDSDAEDDGSRASWPAEHIEKMVANASPECRIASLTDEVEVPLWPVLARGLRFDASLANVDAYVTEVGSVDAALARLLLDAGAIDCPAENSQDTETGRTDADGDEDGAASGVAEMKMRVAVSVLNASATLSDTEVRTRLVEQLGLNAWVKVDAVTPERGPLLGLLIERHICADSAGTFAHFPCEDWDTLQPAIVASANFVEFADPSFIDEAAAQRIFADTTGAGVGDEVREKLLGSLAAYTPVDSRGALLAAGQYALRKQQRLAWAEINRIAAATCDVTVVVGLLALLDEDAVTVPQIEQSLARLGGNYPLLNQTGQKFDLPADPAHRTVLGRLQKDGLVASVRQRRTAPSKVSVHTQS